MPHIVSGIDRALSDPMTLRGRTVRNRIWQAQMSVCYADTEGHVTRAEVEHYGRCSRGGVGVVVTENAAISASGRQLPHQTMISDDRFLPGLTGLASAIHAGGALAITQIVHAGRYAGPWDQYESQRRLAPSPVAFPLLPGRIVTPQEISTEEIEQVIADFAGAAGRAERAGFDGVEIHGAQGFLISQFLSPRTNHRHDMWGGDANGRAAFARAVVRRVRASVSDDFIVGFHLLAEELLPGGVTVSEAIALAAILETDGVDFLIPVTATFEDLHSHRDLMSHHQFQIHRTSAVHDAVSIPVIANGNLGSPADVESIIREGRADAVVLARPLLSEPDWPAKVLAHEGTTVRVCPCDPPQCIRTQLTGVSCHHWPSSALERGYFGYDD